MRVRPKPNHCNQISFFTKKNILKKSNKVRQTQKRYPNITHSLVNHKGVGNEKKILK